MSKKAKNITGSLGFTIVELLIATAVLSVLLLASSIIVVQIGRMYYKGIVLTRTQDAARNITDGISRPIQLEGSSITQSAAIAIGTSKDAKGNGAQAQSICVGNQRYTYALDMKVGRPAGGVQDGEIRHAVWRDAISDSSICTLYGPVDLTQESPTDTSGSVAENPESMLGDNMRLVELSVNETAPGSGLYAVKVGVIYGDDDLIDMATNTCKGQIAGRQWCAKAEYQTVVFKRIRG